MTVIYRQQGMALKVYIVIDGVEYYCGFWWSFLNFVDFGKID